MLATELSVTVTGISNDQGSLLLAMYNSADTFGGKRFNSVQSVAKSGDMRFTFNDLPAGDYSIMVFHDLNDNGELDTNLLGIPTEPYGASL